MRRLLAVIILVVLIFMVSCGPKKVLIKNRFMGETRTVKLLMLPTANTIGSDKNKVKLFNYYIRICSLNQENKEENCKDTLLLENVNPRSLY